MSPTPRLLLCDDAPGFQVLARTVFEQGGFAVVGTAATWADAARLAADLRPDAILLDLWLPVFDADGVARVRAACPTAVLAVVSSLSVAQAREMVASVEAVDLVLSKRNPPDTMVAALRGLLP